MVDMFYHHNLITNDLVTLHFHSRNITKYCLMFCVGDALQHGLLN